MNGDFLHVCAAAYQFLSPCPPTNSVLGDGISMENKKKFEGKKSISFLFVNVSLSMRDVFFHVVIIVIYRWLLIFGIRTDNAIQTKKKKNYFWNIL